MMNDLISVIIPVYNLENYIGPCLESVLGQTYDYLEIIAVDDGSSDGSADILDEYRSRYARIKVIHQENGGVLSARMRGIREAGGEWIGFVDGDDYIEPRMYERLLHNALDSRAQISHCGYQMVFPDRVDYYYGTKEYVMQDGRAALKQLLKGLYEPGVWNKLFHRSLLGELLENRMMEGRIRINEDLLMNYYLFRRAEKTVFEDICPYHYMVRQNSAATAKISPCKLQDPALVRKTLMYETREDPEFYPICLESYVQHLTRVSTMKAGDWPEDIKECILSARKELRRTLKRGDTLRMLSARQRVLSVWAAALPWSYHMVHKLYGEMSGKSHKYDVR
jgi:glycosyltransferase involved in cell wall biosynthesis